jgi:hypothetical protein
VWVDIIIHDIRPRYKVDLEFSELGFLDHDEWALLLEFNT